MKSLTVVPVTRATSQLPTTLGTRVQRGWEGPQAAMGPFGPLSLGPWSFPTRVLRELTPRSGGEAGEAGERPTGPCAGVQARGSLWPGGGLASGRRGVGRKGQMEGPDKRVNNE